MAFFTSPHQVTIWHLRFKGREKLWSRIRRGRRLASQLSEIVPVLAHVRGMVEALTLPASEKKLVVLVGKVGLKPMRPNHTSWSRCPTASPAPVLTDKVIISLVAGHVFGLWVLGKCVTPAHRRW